MATSGQTSTPRQFGSIAVLECTFLDDVVLLLGSSLLAFPTVLQDDRNCPLPQHASHVSHFVSECGAIT